MEKINKMERHRTKSQLCLYFSNDQLLHISFPLLQSRETFVQMIHLIDRTIWIVDEGANFFFFDCLFSLELEIGAGDIKKKKKKKNFFD